jgi:sulfide:quinone oxidoreductase
VIVGRGVGGLACTQCLARGDGEVSVSGVDVAAGGLSTTAGEVEYDKLVLALGAAVAPDAIPGLALAAHGSPRVRTPSGCATHSPRSRVLIAVAGMPFKCPAAPYEARALAGLC